jgi:Zn-dependent protease/predicted transcriptional regulator
MRGTLKLFTWLRIPVFVHWTFGLLVLFYIGWNLYHSGLNLINLALELGLLFILFGCVLLHEYGHSLAARRYGIQTADIILTPIGGIARLERMPERPKQELVVAIAGPLVNVAIAIILWLLGRYVLFANEYEENYFSDTTLFTDDGFNFAQSALELGLVKAIVLNLLISTILVNIVMVLFNMIPAFPMDGGRVLRALLSMRFNRAKATQWASWLGQAFAIVFVLAGTYLSAFSLSLIGVFVFFAARNENKQVQLDARLHIPTNQIMHPIRPEVMALAHDWVSEPLQVAAKHGIRNFLVFDMQNQLCGVLTEQALAAAVKRKRTDTSVSDLMRADVDIIAEDEPLQYAYYLLVQSNRGIIALVNPAGELTGTLDASQLKAWLKT